MQETIVSTFDYHAKLFAHELNRRHSVADDEKLAGALLDAQVDLNPHQVEAALFAFKSPLSKGAILADEAGLGKTIEAGLVLARKWTEGKRRILVITPANLRKQWSQELDEQLKALKKEVRQTGNLPDKLALQRKARALETTRDEAWRAYDKAAKDIEKQKDGLLDQVEERLGQNVSDETLFTIRFGIK